MKKIHFLWMFIFTMTLNSCKSDKQTLQEYLVENKENPSFQSLDVSTNMLEGYLSIADEQTKESIKSVKKISLLGLPIKDNNQEYEVQKEKLSKVLSESENYKSLLKVKKEGVKINLYYKGTPESINEVVLFGYTPEYGLGLARLIGENIKTDKIIELINKVDIPKGALDKIK